MASDILHIKDSFYFEVPRALWRSNRESPQELYKDFGSWVIWNDPDYQDWEAAQIVARLEQIGARQSDVNNLIEQWREWQHSRPLRFGRPLDQFLEDEIAQLQETAERWARKNAPEGTRDKTEAYLAEHPEYPYAWMYRLVSDPAKRQQWREVTQEFNSKKVVETYLKQPNTSWSAEKVARYNNALSGKIFIPQPFATLRNAYEVQSGFGISRYMLIEVAVAIILLFTFRWLAGKIRTGQSPKGKLWNLLESMVVFVRNRVVVPAMGEHDADKYMPLLWTMFMFILGCNLMGMLPWVGAPTSVIATTGALAIIILVVGTVQGIRAFGMTGYLKNIAPSLGLPLYLAVFVVPLVWIIEFASLFIKHAVLAARLLFNMVAGHSVLLGIMGIGFGAHAVTMHTGTWTLVAIISVVGATLLSFLELFVAFLQAYIFTFLAAMFIGSATHHH
jgi:F-type H+-transporting ATPase subunit a